MRILLGDQTGRVRAELVKGAISDVTWRVNGTGSATVTVKRGDVAFRRELLQPGSRIYVEFENGLPAWGGVLDLPRTWRAGQVEMRAYTVERLLRFSITSKSRAFYSSLVGGIFAETLRELDAKAGIGITIGQVWAGGAVHYPRYHFRDGMWVINNSVRKMETCDYRFRPYLDGDRRIVFIAELHELLGDDKREKVALVEGANVGPNPTLVEQGDIVNRVAVIGSGATWGEREIVYAVEENSRKLFGLRELCLAPADVTQPETLNRYAETAIREMAYPHALANLKMANVSPARYADYVEGDIVQVQLSSCGFDGYDAPMRVVARGFDPRSKVCEVVTDERFEYVPVLQGDDETQPGVEEQE